MARRVIRDNELGVVFAALFLFCGIGHAGEDPKTFTLPDDALLIGHVALFGENPSRTAEALFTGVATGRFTRFIDVNESVPAGNGQVYTIKEGKSSILLTVLKGTSLKFEDNPFFCRLGISGAASKPGDWSAAVLYLYVGADGSVMAWARNRKTKGRLQVRLMEPEDAPE